MPTYPNIQNLLIDLGGVLYDIDIAKTIKAYQALARNPDEALSFTTNSQGEWFSKLDRGEVSIEAFADGLIADFDLDTDQATVITIWNDLLLGLMPQRPTQIAQLAPDYHLALLSNTSRQHHSLYKDECAEMFSHFERLFFSFDMGMRKPDAIIFEKVLAEMNWQAAETLFIDDSTTNIAAAKALGIQTAWIEHPAVFDQLVGDLVASRA